MSKICKCEKSPHSYGPPSGKSPKRSHRALPTNFSYLLMCLTVMSFTWVFCYKFRPESAVPSDQALRKVLIP